MQKRCQLSLQLDENRVCAVDHVSIVEPQDDETLLSQKPIPTLVMVFSSFSLVAVAIDLHDDPSRQPSEICNIGANRSFAAESRSPRAKIS